MRCVEKTSMACGWCVAQTLLLTRGPTSEHHLPVLQQVLGSFINTFTKVHELKTVLKITLRDPHLLEIKLAPAECRRRLKPAPWISTLGELFLAENTRYTDY